MVDYAGTDSMNHPERFILPGQVRSIPIYSAGLKTVRVSVTLTGLVYDDRSSEGDAARIVFNTRERNAREAREAATKEPPGEKRAALEKRAEWYEAHAVEAQQ